MKFIKLIDSDGAEHQFNIAHIIKLYMDKKDGVTYIHVTNEKLLRAFKIHIDDVMKLIKES